MKNRITFEKISIYLVNFYFSLESSSYRCGIAPLSNPSLRIYITLSHLSTTPSSSPFHLSSRLIFLRFLRKDSVIFFLSSWRANKLSSTAQKQWDYPRFRFRAEVSFSEQSRRGISARICPKLRYNTWWPCSKMVNCASTLPIHLHLGNVIIRPIYGMGLLIDRNQFVPYTYFCVRINNCPGPPSRLR